MMGLRRGARAPAAGPFSLPSPRDRAPGEAPPVAEVPAVPYGTWELLRKGKDCAILAVGVMCKPALESAELLAADGVDVSVVNARFLKPMDREMLDALAQSHKLLV